MNHADRTADYNRLMDAAKVRAHQLREQAMHDFFDGASLAARRGLRSANRLAQSLARHVHLRRQQQAWDARADAEACTAGGGR